MKKEQGTDRQTDRRTHTYIYTYIHVHTHHRSFIGLEVSQGYEQVSSPI